MAISNYGPGSDLCEECFAKRAADEQALYEQVTLSICIYTGGCTCLYKCRGIDQQALYEQQVCLDVCLYAAAGAWLEL